MAKRGQITRYQAFIEWHEWFKKGESQKNNAEALKRGRLYSTRGVVWEGDKPFIKK